MTHGFRAQVVSWDPNLDFRLHNLWNGRQPVRKVVDASDGVAVGHAVAAGVVAASAVAAGPPAGGAPGGERPTVRSWHVSRSPAA